MNGPDLTEEELRAALADSRDTRSLAVLCAGMGMGLVFMAAASALMAAGVKPGPAPEGATRALQYMSGAHALVALGCYAAARVLTNARLRVLREVDGSLDASTVITEYRATRILSLALFEGPALFGLSIVLTGFLNHVLPGQPVYCLNALTAVIALVQLARNFPSEQRVVAWFRDAVADRG